LLQKSFRKYRAELNGLESKQPKLKMSEQTPTELGAAERQLSDFPGNVVTVAAIVAVIVRGSNPQWGGSQRKREGHFPP
jgi:hypothetical protein